MSINTPHLWNEPALPARNFSAMRRVLAAMLLASVAIPLVCFAGYCYFDYQRRLAAIAEGLDRLTLVAHEQALKVFEMNTAIAGRVDDVLGYDTPAGIRQREAPLHQRLADMSADSPQVSAISVYGPAGVLLASSLYSPPPEVSINDRDDFRAARDLRPQPYFSLPYVERLKGETVVTTTVGRSDERGAFLGVVSVALRRSYFIDFYRQLIRSSPGMSVGLYRRVDGGALVQVANSDRPVEPAGSAAFTRALRDNVLYGSFETGSRHVTWGAIVSFRRAGAYPLYVATTYDKQVLFHDWSRNLLVVAAITAVPCAAIWALILFSFLQLRTEELAWRHWQNEVALRISAEAASRELMKLGAMGNLVANVAHAFNNLLAVVSSITALAREKAFSNLEPEVVSLEGAALDARTLAQRLMSVARKQILTPALLHLDAWLPSNGPVIQVALGDDIELLIQVQDVWPVMVDPRELQAALVNIACNAKEAMRGPGRVTLRCRNLTSPVDTAALTGEYVLISVSDNGSGMSGPVARHAFEPFFTTKRGAAGTGLGLTQVLSMCDQAGGAARIDSAAGNGTTVSIYLPRSRAPITTQTSQTIDPPSPAASSTAVLLVEDDVHVAAGVSALLELFGCAVIHESSADGALMRLRAGDRFDVVLSDIQMPGELNGIDLAEEVQRRWPHSRIALMTGYAEEMTRARGVGIPMFGKPFNVDELKAFIFDSGPVNPRW
ncbi:ATP-binding protein [Paraburkholderia sp. IW21]|uniref:ATP-binding protein n=1 Tax=Paraburkholderia sp. IW21 TaxID=3242488 RepID=UPI003522028C